MFNKLLVGMFRRGGRCGARVGAEGAGAVAAPASRVLLALFVYLFKTYCVRNHGGLNSLQGLFL